MEMTDKQTYWVRYGLRVLLIWTMWVLALFGICTVAAVFHWAIAIPAGILIFLCYGNLVRALVQSAAIEHDLVFNSIFKGERVYS
jgi:hypothetical protein